MKVTLLGPVPPPYGGVSVHIERLGEKLSARGIKVSHVTEQKPGESFTSFLRRGVLGKRSHVLHAHVHNPWTLWALGMRSVAGWPTVVTIHNARVLDWLGAVPAWKKRIMMLGVHRVHQYIAVSEVVQTQLETLGVPSDRIRVLPAFLAPSRSDWETIAVPANVEAFSQNVSPLISMNAFHLEEVEGVPLYGADLIGPFLLALRRDRPEAGVLLYVAREGNGADLERLREKWKELGVADGVHVVEGSKPFGPALVRSSVFLRPTSTDGDSVSVREALAVGVPVVASDVCERPEGCHVFQSRDPEKLAETVLDVLKQDERISLADMDEHALETILETYVAVGGVQWEN